MAYRRILIRRDTAANWTSANPVLGSGELGGETDTGKLKLGNGSTAWNSLAYLGGVTSINGETGTVTGLATLASPTFTGTVTTSDLTVSGNLTVSGTTTSINTETLTIDDNIIVLNNNEEGTPSQNAGIEVERGTSANVVLRWNETTDKWELTNDGTNYSNIAAGDYVGTITAGTGVSSTGATTGEGIAHTLSIGQAVATTSDVEFAGLKIATVREPVLVSATAMSATTVNIDAKTNPTVYYTTNATANGTVNVRSTSSESLNTLLSVGDMITATFMVTNGATPYRPTTFQVDGSSVTPKWQGGSAPSAGNASSIDAYTMTVLKTADATFTMFAAQTRFA